MLLTLLAPSSGPRIYAVIYASALAAPSAAQIKAGQNVNGVAATWAGSIAAPTSTQTVDWPSLATGLTAGTSYRVSTVWSDGTANSNVDTSEAWTATTGSTVVAGDGVSPGRSQAAAAVGAIVETSAAAAQARAHSAGVAQATQPAAGAALSRSQAAAPGEDANVGSVVSGAGVAQGRTTAVAVGVAIDAVAARSDSRTVARAAGAGLEASATRADARSTAAAVGRAQETAQGASQARSAGVAPASVTDAAVGRADGRGAASSTGEDAFGNLSVPGTGRAASRSQAVAVGLAVEATAARALAQAQASSQAVALAAAAGASAAIAQARAGGFPVEAAAGAAIARAQAAAVATERAISAGRSASSSTARGVAGDGAVIDPTVRRLTWRPAGEADLVHVAGSSPGAWRARHADTTWELDE